MRAQGQPVILMVEMRSLRIVALLLMISLVAVPLAMAVDGCAGGGMMCAAPCSAPCVATPVTVAGLVLLPSGDVASPTFGLFRFTARDALDAPPKFLLVG